MCRPVSDGRLRLDGKEQCRVKVVDVADTRFPAVVVGVLAVAVRVRNAKPDDGKGRPADDKRGAEHGHDVAPAHIDQSGEDVDEVAASALRHVLAGDAVQAVLVDYSLPLTSGEASSAISHRLEHTTVARRPVPAIRIPLHAGHLFRVMMTSVIRWLQLRFDFDSTTVRRLFD